MLQDLFKNEVKNLIMTKRTQKVESPEYLLLLVLKEHFLEMLANLMYGHDPLGYIYKSC